ncbi:RagB/SusD family nutrient uptake outer membrane protein [Prevotella sp. P5-92]|uniref:RagB/SusD family nutrient uptake outer membrane protein n=1 Tax=Prevotella sp. P5-92 TaxID=2024222 RepID=UPI000B975FFF|nr:RagB/SusD family nutrient uptake outer membrane protein [Prevotella sp. P5-92]OYP58409.1 RagB/SusD family nutrient uptake outer membrane protein [Prevotella sp. P5-92]
MKKIFYIATALCTMGLASCDIDNVENIGEMSSSQFPKTDADAEAVLAGVYQNLNEIHANPQMSFLYNACLASDDQLGGGGTNDKLMQAEDLLMNYNADMTNQFYADRFKGISRANTLLEVLEGSEGMSEDVKNQAIGEAKFLRAYYYYELASMYGNVPLVRNAAEADNKQGDVKVLWGQILQDLRDAASSMPAENSLNSSRVGHVDKYTAEAMLGRAWLFYTGMYCNGTTVADMVSTTYNPLTSVELPDGTTLTKQDVIGYIDDCVNNSGYSLVDDFRNLWAYTNKKTINDYPYVSGKGLAWVENDNGINPESMFAIKFNKQASWNTTIGYSNGYALHFGVRGGQDIKNTFPFGQGWGAGPVAPNLVKDWKVAEPNDIRLKATICDVNDTEEMPNYGRGGWADFVQETDYYAKKWSPIACKNDGTIPGSDGNPAPEYAFCFETCMYGMTGGQQGGYGNNFQLDNIHDQVLIRFADVLLMQSELKEDVTGINKVRARAGLDPIAAYSLKALQDERRWEFACEGIRWNDIRRWHIASVALDKQEGQDIYYCGSPAKNEAASHNGGYSTRYKATAGFQKMPDTQVALGTVVQNEGWTAADSEYGGW